jgi:signal transduction histidine kinase/ActR/RegA family two-component response regulator
MSDLEQDRLERRVLILAPLGRDGALTEAILTQAGVQSLACDSLESLGRELKRGACLVLLAEEAIAPGSSLQTVVARQPVWSDLPFVILTIQGAASEAAAEAVETLGNVTLLERPVRVATLVSAVRTALRARERQYQIRAHLLALARAERALKEADRRKDEFLAILAHELRNPLAPIRNSLEILHLTNADNPANEKVREVIERQVNHMVRLVDDLMEISRITRGKIELRKERVELAGVLRNALETSRPLIKAGGHSLTVALPEEPILLEGDSVRLAQIFSNLLNNAAKYTEERGQIWLSADREGAGAVISVRDSGIGIPPQQLPHVFELFMQGERHYTRMPSGLGIGLTLVKSLVELHGGTVEAHSEGFGGGSEFVVRLPVLADARPANAPGAESAAATALPARRVLVVDDNRDAADSLGVLLRLLGAEVYVAHSGPEALEQARLHRPAVVLLDLGMPGMDGYQVARRLRQLPGLADITLIALTGWGQDADRRDSAAAGFNHHLTKPADLKELEALLERRKEGTRQ